MENPRTISDNGIERIKQWEGLRLKAYRDEAGILTIGYGYTSVAGNLEVREGMVITEPEAERLLKATLKKHEDRVFRLVKVAITQSQFDALVSFDYNTGALDKSTLLKELNTGNYGIVPRELAKWVKVTVGGKKVTSKGLVKRRSEEAALFVSDDKEPELKPTRGSLVTRATAPVISKENVSFATGIASSGAAVVATVSEGAEPIQYAIAGIMIVSFIVGLVYFIKRRGL
jgi:lysozyme